MIKRTITLNSAEGLTPLLAAEIVKSAQSRECSLECESGNGRISIKSLMAVLSLGLGRGAQVELFADGSDENAAVDDIERILGG